jgi:hypothetical protein
MSLIATHNIRRTTVVIAAVLWTVLVIAGQGASGAEAAPVVLAAKAGPHPTLLVNLRGGWRPVQEAWSKAFADKELGVDTVPPFGMIELAQQPTIIAVESLESASPLTCWLQSNEANDCIKRIHDSGSAGTYLVYATKPRFWSPSLVIILGKTDAAAAAGVDFSRLKDADDEAYLFTVLEKDGRPLVDIVGKTERGMNAGAAWLRARISRRGGSMTIDEHFSVRGGSPEPNVIVLDRCDLLRKPGIHGREASIYDAGAWYSCGMSANNGMNTRMSRFPYEERKVGIQQWGAKELTRYVDYLSACGFSTVWTHGHMSEGWGDSNPHWGHALVIPGSRKYMDEEYINNFNRDDTWEKYDDEVFVPMAAALSKAARDRGMTFGVVFSAWSGLAGWEEGKPDEAAKRAASKERCAYLARKYGPYLTM